MPPPVGTIAPPTDAASTATTIRTTTLQQSTTNPANAPNGQTTHNTFNTSDGRRTSRGPQNVDQETLLNVPNLHLASTANTEAYTEHVRTLHSQLAGGDITEYVESKIALPRSLQGLRTGQVIAKLFTLNKDLESDAWSAVMNDVVGTNLVIGTVSETGREQIDKLMEVKVEPGRTVKVPPASKPNNMYYVECLLPYERELHVAFMEIFLRTFPTARHISMPGKKAWGTTRRLRLYFNATTAPREVFTPEDPNTPIREIKLSCGTAAQIIHKWQRLNQFRPPHLLNRWNGNNPARTYAAAAASTRPTQPQTPPNPQPSTNAPPITAPRPQVPRRPGEVPQGPPTQQFTDPQTDPATHPKATQVEWHTNEPFPAPITPNLPNNQVDTTPPETRNSQDNPNNTTTPNVPDRDEHMSDSAQTPSQRDTHTPPPHPTNRIEPDNTRTIPPTTTNSNMNPTNVIDTDAPTKTPQQHTQPARATKPNPAHPAPSRGTDETEQWHQVKRPRIKKPQPQTSESKTQAPIQKSQSKNRKSTRTNKFKPLDFIILPSFVDDEIAPIEVTLKTKPTKPPRRVFKDTKRAVTKNVAEAITHSQEVRHPSHTLTHLSPQQSQVILRSPDPVIKEGRDRLIRQIALLRAARTNASHRQALLDQHADNAYLQQVQARLAECPDPPTCNESSPIDMTLSTLLDRDELRVRGAVCYAWIDLATRAVLPHLYDMWPDPPTWNGMPLQWLPADDSIVPCLQDEALATLAACPTLHKVWTHVTSPNPELHSAVQIAANQWHRFIASKAAPRTEDATTLNSS